jgi:chromosome segregation ATPase
MASANPGFLQQFSQSIANIKTKQQEINTKRAQYTRVLSEGLKDITNRIGALSGRINALKQSVGQMRQQLESNTAQLQQKEAELQQLGRQKEAEAQQLRTEIDRLRQSNQALEQNIQASTADINSINGDLQALSDSLSTENAQQILAQLTQSIDTLERTLDGAPGATRGGAAMGGSRKKTLKKIRKHRKKGRQTKLRGGFVYNSKSTRHSLSSSPSSKSSRDKSVSL